MTPNKPVARTGPHKKLHRIPVLTDIANRNSVAYNKNDPKITNIYACTQRLSGREISPCHWKCISTTPTRYGGKDDREIRWANVMLCLSIYRVPFINQQTGSIRAYQTLIHAGQPTASAVEDQRHEEAKWRDTIWKLNGLPTYERRYINIIRSHSIACYYVVHSRRRAVMDILIIEKFNPR